jgi:hypothetical protein
MFMDFPGFYHVLPTQLLGFPVFFQGFPTAPGAAAGAAARAGGRQGLRGLDVAAGGTGAGGRGGGAEPWDTMV